VVGKGKELFVVESQKRLRETRDMNLRKRRIYQGLAQSRRPFKAYEDHHDASAIHFA
jgi:hypothetical protein